MFGKLARLGQALANDIGIAAEDVINEGFVDGQYRLVEVRFGSGGTYEGWEWRELSPSEAAELPYVNTGGARSPFLTPVAPFSGNCKEMLRRLRKGLEGVAQWASQEKHEEVHAEVDAVLSGISAANEAIIDDLETAQEQLDDEDHQLIMRLVIAGKDGWKPVCDEVAPELLRRSVESRFGKTQNAQVSLSEACCSLCGREKPVVYGNFSRLKTYHLDQPGAIKGGYTVEGAARNFPVCPECAIYASYGIDRVQQDLQFYMFGIEYLIIPDATDDELLLDFYHNAVTWQKQRASLTEKSLRRLTGDEREILDLIGQEYKNTASLSFSLVFFRAQKAQWHILAEVPEVLPSWFHNLYQAKKHVEDELPYDMSLQVTLGVVRDATVQAQGASDKDSDRLFLQWTEAILRGGSLERSAVMRVIVDYILRVHREDARREEGRSAQAYFETLKASLLVRLLEELNIIDTLGGNGMVSPEVANNKWAKYLKEHKDFFGLPEARVAFLTGALVRQLAWVQQKDRSLQSAEDAPIYKKVRGLRVDRRQLQRLLGELKQKLLAYDSDRYYSDIQELLASEWTYVGANWNLSNDETTFYFTLGLNLSWHISSPKEEPKESQ